MADAEDMDAAWNVVADATLILEWCAVPGALLIDDNGVGTPIVPEELQGIYRDALDQAHRDFFALALGTLRGENPTFSRDQVLQALDEAGWTGPMRLLKLQILDGTGRPTAMELPRADPPRAGGIADRIFRPFLKALNAALGSLSVIPGVEPIKELKEFLDASIA